MTRLLFIALLIFFSLPGQSQIVGWRVDKFITEKSIDTFLVYSFPCNGGIAFDSCQNDEPTYLIWKLKGGYFLKRFDYCNTFKAISIDTINSLTYYLENKKVIDREEIKQPTYYEIKKRGKKVDKLTVTSTIDHSCYHKFQLPLTKNPNFKYADTYDLNFKTFDNGKKNAYYTHNQNTKFKMLIDLTTSFINDFKARGKFERE